MSTADVARDMDWLRQALGDAQLNYLGYSYGSQLGQTYVNLFPDNGRAIVIDGVLDPEAWAGVANGDRFPAGYRLRSGDGARLTLNQFFRLCDEAGPRCKFSGDSKRRWNRLVRKFQNDPAFVRRVGGSYADFIALTLGLLYAPFIWPDLARFYRILEREASQERIDSQTARIRDKLGLAPPRQENYPNIIEGLPGVLCSDGINPRDYLRWRRSADRAQEQQGHFGRLWTWNGSACAFWPTGAGKDQYLGPWDARTANPVLIVGNRYDPATPYTGAQAAARLLPNSRLLTYAGWGHTAFFSGNFCIDANVTRYLVTTTVPAAGTVCQPAGSPFGRLSARASSSAAFAAAIAGTLPLPVRRALNR
jgi:pimeloyl-ACP methyl ester carboxylesterase